MKGAQLALPVLLQQVPRFENFFAGPNAEVVDLLRAVAAGRPIPGVWIYGAPASGKSHLLAALVEAAPQARWLDGEPDDLAGLEGGQTAVIAMDDVDQRLQRPEQVHALMRLVDGARLRHQSLVLAAGVAPSRLAGVLPDLRSRFESMAVLGLKPLRDQDRRELLDLHARARGLRLGEDAVRWLLAHLQRDAGSLIAALEVLDRAALSAQRRPTLRFVQQVLGQPPVLPARARETGQTGPG